MSSYPFRDGQGNLKYAAVASGTGTELDPYVLAPTDPPTTPPSIVGYTHSLVPVTDVGTTVFAFNVNRQDAIIVNRSLTDPCDIFLSAVGSYGEGLPLSPGAKLTISPLYQGIVTAKTATGIVLSLAVAQGV